MSDREIIEETKKDAPDQMEPVIPEAKAAEADSTEPEAEAAEADSTEPEVEAVEADSTEPEVKATEADSTRSRSVGRRSGNRRVKQQTGRTKKEHQASQRENILRLREIKKKKAAMPYMKILAAGGAAVAVVAVVAVVGTVIGNHRHEG